MVNKVVVLGRIDLPTFEVNKRVLWTGGYARAWKPRCRTTGQSRKSWWRMGIIVVGSLGNPKKFESMVRVYGVDGLAPTLGAFMGEGGNNVPMVLIEDE